MQYTNCLSLSDIEKVIVNLVFFVHTSRKRQRLRQSQSSENTLCVGIREMPVLEKRKMKNCRGIEKGSVSEDCKDCFLNK